MEWTRKQPIAPPNGTPSDWYWFWFDGEKQPTILEVWAGRFLDRLKGHWLLEPIAKPTYKPGEEPPTKINYVKVAIPSTPPKKEI